MTGETFTCELTPERLDEGERELAAALAAWARRNQERLRPRRERLEPILRTFGLVACATGALVSGWAVTQYPLDPCPAAAARSSETFYQVMTPVFAVLGVLFWFLPRVTAALRAWAPGASARRAPGAMASLRRALPSQVTYRLLPDGVESHLTRPRRDARTAFRAVHGAIAGRRTICLFAGPPLARLLRLVWLPDDAARGAVLAALEAARVPVLPLPADDRGGALAGPALLGLDTPRPE